MESFDVAIIGASFSGLALAHHLPKELRVLVVDAKPAAGATVESTGLITSRTREEFASFFPIDQYITNPISAICVVAPDFQTHFVSRVAAPWIFQTDTKALVKAMADRVPSSVTLRTGTVFLGSDDLHHPSHIRIQSRGKGMEEVGIRFLVGADGGHSKVAATHQGLDKNTRFLFGYEQVFFGNVHLGPCPTETIYHFWFGEFSLGYGGWLSPTVVEGKKAFRIGLAKLMKDRGDAKQLMEKFRSVLQEKGIISYTNMQANYTFGSHIPIGGARRRISCGNVLLIGDAAGFCGAFAADGIKGSLVSGKEAAPLIADFLQGNTRALSGLRQAMDCHGSLMGYYRRQLGYRFIWARMKRDRTFRAMYDIIEQEQDTFLQQFCDSKDKRRSLSRTVLKWRHVPKLVRYGIFVIADFFRS